MNVTFFPSFSDQLRQAGVDPVALIEALEAYQVSIDEFVKLNFDQYEEPLKWIQAMDRKNTISAFAQLVPLLCPESETCIALEGADGDDLNDFDDE